MRYPLFLSFLVCIGAMISSCGKDSISSSLSGRINQKTNLRNLGSTTNVLARNTGQQSPIVDQPSCTPLLDDLQLTNDVWPLLASNVSEGELIAQNVEILCNHPSELYRDNEEDSEDEEYEECEEDVRKDDAVKKEKLSNCIVDLSSTVKNLSNYVEEQSNYISIKLSNYLKTVDPTDIILTTCLSSLAYESGVLGYIALGAPCCYVLGKAVDAATRSINVTDHIAEKLTNSLEKLSNCIIDPSSAIKNLSNYMEEQSNYISIKLSNYLKTVDPTDIILTTCLSSLAYESGILGYVALGAPCCYALAKALDADISNGKRYL